MIRLGVRENVRRQLARFDEFQELMFDLLGVTDRKDYPLDRLKVFWPPISNALTRQKAKEISKSVFPFSRTF